MTRERFLKVIDDWLADQEENNYAWVEEHTPEECTSVTLDGSFNLQKLADMLVAEVEKPA